MIQDIENAQDATNINFDEKVQVYFNSDIKQWSIRQGKVKVHCEYVCLRDAEFKVSQRGRERVLKNKRKNIHAFITGYIVREPAKIPYNIDQPWDAVSYNPYQNQSFILANGSPIHAAAYVDMMASSEVSKVIARI